MQNTITKHPVNMRSVVITSADGSCVDEYCDNIICGGGTGECEADFDYETDGLTAVFENNSDGIGLAYTWTFGDGDISYETNPDHTLMHPETYLVCLTVYGADSCTDTFCDEVEVDGIVGDCAAAFLQLMTSQQAEKAGSFL